MITSKQFNYIKKKHGKYASWAIWADQEGEKAKSNIEELRVLDPAINKDLLSQLNPNVIFVGLNKSRNGNKKRFSNFHSSHANDYNIRFAFKNSPYWGGYMTDLIKGYVEKEAGEVVKYLRIHNEFERQNIEKFRKELKDLKDIGAIDPTLIAFGGDTIKVLKRNNLYNEYEILEIYHYSHQINQENYRTHVRLRCGF